MSVLGKVSRITSYKLSRISCAVKRNTFFTYTAELSQPVDHTPKCCCPEEAFADTLKSDQTVFVHGAAATPIKLLDAMTEVGKKKCLSNVRVLHMHTEGPAAYTDKSCEGIFRSCSLFMAANVRKAVAEGRSDAIPIFLVDIPKLFRRKFIQPDVSIVQVSPPDQHGFCSLGTSVDCVRAALLNTKTIIAQVNCNMPRTFGDSILHMSHIDYMVEGHGPLPAHDTKAGSEEESRIGKYIAENLVEDGATLQMGIGSIPDAVLAALTSHKNLGIHTEMFSSGVIELVRRGCITNSLKPTHRGRIVGSFLVGNQELFDFVDNNPLVEMLEIDYVNNIHVISKLPRMTAINSCIEVDLTGQVCSDSIGTRMYSGFGGQVDFIRGAAEGFDGLGKPIIALRSLTARGESKIVPTLKAGAGVVTSRAHVHYVVTEHGIANLFGKTLRQRAHALIQIADPKHRETLEKAAFDRLKCMPCP